MRKFYRLLARALVLGIVVAVIGMTGDLVFHGRPPIGESLPFKVSALIGGAGMVLFGVALFVLFWGAFFQAAVGFWHNANHAIAPIPSVQEIANQLQAEGYSPTLQDVLAVEQHLKSERNESALAAALFVGVVHELPRIAKGQPLL